MARDIAAGLKIVAISETITGDCSTYPSALLVGRDEGSLGCARNRGFSTHVIVLPTDGREEFTIQGHYDLTLAEAMSSLEQQCAAQRWAEGQREEAASA
jgi:hypothetical protein